MAKEKEESSGFPLDDMIEEVCCEPQDEWEQRERERREKVAGLMAKAIVKKGAFDEDSIKKSIMEFYDMAQLMRSV